MFDQREPRHEGTPERGSDLHQTISIAFEEAVRGGQHPFMPVEAFYLDDPDGNEIEIATWRGQ